MRTIVLGEWILTEKEMRIIEDWAKLASDTRINLYPEEADLISEIQSRPRPLSLIEVLEQNNLIGKTIVDELFPEGFAEGLL
jgi:hypothetical protein